MLSVAAGHVHDVLQSLGFGLADFEEAEPTWRATFEQQQAWIAAQGPGPIPIQGDGVRVFNEASRALALLMYRIETFCVFARVFLDDVAVMISKAFAPSGVDVGSHTDVEKHLTEMAEARGLTGAEKVVEQAVELTGTVKSYRDTYVVHRSRLRLRSTKGLSVTPETVRISVGGLIYPNEGEQAQMVESPDVRQLHATLYRYLDAVMDLIEQLPSVGTS